MHSAHGGLHARRDRERRLKEGGVSRTPSGAVVPSPSTASRPQPHQRGYPQMSSCTARRGAHLLLWWVAGCAVVLCQAWDHHLGVALGTQGARLQQRLAEVHTPAPRQRIGGYCMAGQGVWHGASWCRVPWPPHLLSTYRRALTLSSALTTRSRPSQKVSSNTAQAREGGTRQGGGEPCCCMVRGQEGCGHAGHASAGRAVETVIVPALPHRASYWRSPMSKRLACLGFWADAVLQGAQLQGGVERAGCVCRHRGLGAACRGGG